jgi:hypothetical protein
MNIFELAEHISYVTDEKFREIVEFIIEAVRDYPEYGLADTTAYFERLRSTLGVRDFTSSDIASRIESIVREGSDDWVWRAESLSSFLLALEAMDRHHIPFVEVIRRIEEYSKLRHRHRFSSGDDQ